MEPMLFNDPNIHPTDELVFSVIGENSVYWEQLIEYLYDKHFDITEEWRYYSDGKSWLYRALRKKNTIYWIRVTEDTFIVSFWFGDKAEPTLMASTLPESLKDEFRNAKWYSHSRCLSIEIRTAEDVQNAIALIELKVKTK